MAQLGRPPLTYADPYLDAARENEDQWQIFEVDPLEMAPLAALKLMRRRGFTVRYMELDRNTYVLAVKTK